MNASSLADIATRLSTAFAAVTAVVAGVAAAMKFFTWWRDRLLAERIQAAEALKASGLTPAMRDFARDEYVRLRFLQLTGIDRNHGYDTLLECHRYLGGTDLAWRRMHRAGRFLIVEGPRAVVRPFGAWIWVGAAVAFVVCAILSLSALTMLVYAASQGLFAERLTLKSIADTVVFAFLAAGTVPWVWIAGSFAALVLDAASLRRTLAKRT